MGGVPLEFTLSFPTDRRYSTMLREVVVSAARQSGCADAEAEAFGRRVEQAADVLDAGPTNASVSVSVRQVDGAVEVEIDSGGASRTLSTRT